ncbi:MULTISPECIES: putative lipid II flippase FtsW [Brevibacillus]|jgi:cell division protein FtsW|uniref:Probable peptidoglycan glycosyltransferase FtsW n=1 Tax=Brevibacillus borstelensis AK1 TaxID=1300222 RepID=M8E3D5_9BACL|nr:putative lipid II flippase FtsW [Brevibacillus borstelensis]EMT53791.1 cell cycle protein [Brevibacillus borstelensis AK1]KKX56805.1 stage V sporulation protein E [Brevibacillus borstelensis cifa_chp40]MCC0562537.1 putative lipid II flippase FtsW [Brevibacillus borstelensis]MCM3469855.1 putative lipid II flippase FtsW [Brevibacillus borstelensis]MCM3561526.1 putative lipid II flippase FtsW [Brevibacillus borstelensis]
MKTRGVPDFLLLLLTALLVGFGITMVLSSSSIYALTSFTSNGCKICGGDELYFVKRQAMWLLLGIFGMLITMNIPFSFYKRNFLLIVFVSFLSLLLVIIPGIGNDAKGARSWFSFGSVNLQPAEFAKLGLILYLAAIISKKGDGFRDLKKGLMPPLVVTGAFFILIMVQPDMGSAAILLGTAIVVMICGGARIGHLFMIGFPVTSLAVFAYVMKKDHAWNRLTSFLDPWSDPLGTGYHIKQSLIAIAHGGLTGTGFGKSIQKYLYLPEAHTDFIFAIISEELGFFGTSLFLLVYLLFILRGIHICLKVHDTFASLVGIGIVSMIGIQAFVNIGGVTSFIPLTGVTLPFISYGGSSLLMTLVSTGILLSVSREVSRQKLTEQGQKQLYANR